MGAFGAIAERIHIDSALMPCPGAALQAGCTAMPGLKIRPGSNGHGCTMPDDCAHRSHYVQPGTPLRSNLVAGLNTVITDSQTTENILRDLSIVAHLLPNPPPDEPGAALSGWKAPAALILGPI